VADLHLVRDNVAVFVADGFDAGNGETSIAQVGIRFLQGVVEIVLKLGGAFGRSQEAGVNAIGFVFSGLSQEFDLTGICGRPDLRLIVEPLGWRGENEKNDEDDGHIVLPATAFVGPEERAVENWAEVSHVSLPECHRQ